MDGAKKAISKAKMLKIGWFSTGRDKAARDLLKVIQDNIRQGRIKADICFTFRKREPGETTQSDLFFKLVMTCPQ